MASAGDNCFPNEPVPEPMTLGDLFAALFGERDEQERER